MRAPGASSIVAIVAVVAITGCPRPEPASVGPASRPRVQVIECKPAIPSPVAIDESRPARRRPAPTATRRGITIPGAPTSITGVQSPVAITRVLQVHRARFEACSSLLSGPDGRVSLSFTIDHRGQVVAATGSRQPIGRCLARVARTLRFPPARAGSVVRATYALVVSPAARVDDDDDEPPDASGEAGSAGMPWTPYGTSTADGVPWTAAARATEAAVHGRLAAVDKCFGAGTPTGSMRAMIELDAEGTPTVVRVGGLGAGMVERCVADALSSAHVALPNKRATEVACDLARGDASAWRIDPEAGYALVTVTRTGVTHGKRVLAPGEESSPLPGGKTYLVVVDPDVPGALVDLGLQWTSASRATVVGMREPSGPPRWLGAGPSSGSSGDDDPDASVVSLTVEHKVVAACVDTAMQIAALANPRAVSALMKRVATRCRKRACIGTVDVAVGGAARARDLIEVIASARRAGVDRLLLGGGPGCSVRPVEAPER